MRNAVYILLAVFLVQLSGLRVLCISGQVQKHSCCPMSEPTTPSSSSSLPDCCLSSILNFQGFITEAPSTDPPSEYTAHSTAVALPLFVRFARLNSPVRNFVLASVSPPLSPLSQSCLLLI